MGKMSKLSGWDWLGIAGGGLGLFGSLMSGISKTKRELDATKQIAAIVSKKEVEDLLPKLLAEYLENHK